MQNSFFFIYYLGTGAGISRFAVVASSKVSPKAATRNKIKRRIKKVIYNLLPDIKPGLDAVILVRPKIKDQKFLQLEASLVEIFKKASIFLEKT